MKMYTFRLNDKCGCHSMATGTPDQPDAVVTYEAGDIIKTTDDLSRFVNKFTLLSVEEIAESAPPVSAPVEEETGTDSEEVPTDRGEEVTDQFEGALDKDCTVYKKNDLYDLYLNGVAKSLQISEKKVRSVISKI